MLAMQCTPSSSEIPATGSGRLVYLLVEVSGDDGVQHLPVHLGFVIDVSDSMRIRLVTRQQFGDLLKNGQATEVLTDGVPAYQVTTQDSQVLAALPRRIDYVRDALLIASDYLRSQDTFSLVAFAGQASCLIPSTSGGEKVRLRQAAQELEYLRLGDGTQMAAGLAAAFDEVQKPLDHMGARRLVLLTDGHTQNVGECYAWAQKAREAEIRLSTMGIGAEFNEDLLIPLADKTGGLAYYIETPDRIPQAFREELGTAFGVSYRNLEVKLHLPQGVALRQVYRVLPELGLFDPGPDLGSSYALLLGDYSSGASLSLLVELLLPPWPAGTYRLAQALLAWDDPSQPDLHRNQRQDVIVHLVTQDPQPADTRVMKFVEKVGAYKMGNSAIETAQHAGPHDREAATIRLRQAATRLLDMGEAGIAGTMFGQADALEQTGSLDPEAAKKMRYETRRLAQDREE